MNDMNAQSIIESIFIEGLVEQKILDNLNLEGVWYFVSYSPKDFPIGTLFQNKEGKRFKLLNVHLQFKKSLVKQIDRGWKTICQFDNQIENQIPRNGWGFNKRAVQLWEIPLTIIRNEKIDEILS